MIIEAGKPYRTRDGRRAYVIGPNEDSKDYIWSGNILGMPATWTVDGYWHLRSGTDSRDLIAPWEEPEDLDRCEDEVKKLLVSENECEPPRFDKFSAEQRPEMPEGFSGNLDTRTVREQIDARQAAKPLQPQVGDIVHVRCRVKRDMSLEDVDKNGCYCGGTPFGWMQALISIEPRKPCVGDECEWTDVHGKPFPAGTLEGVGNGWLVFRDRIGSPYICFYSIDYLVSRPGFRIVSRASQEKKG